MRYRPYIEQVALGAISSWEATAILSRGRVPTVTSQVLRLPKPARAVLIAAVTAWFVQHFEIRRP